MKRSIVLSALIVLGCHLPAMAREYGATTLGSNERLVWRFDPRPTGAGRGWTGPIGYACRVYEDLDSATVDRYRIQYGGGDYLYLEPIDGMSLSEDGEVSRSDPKPESYVWQRAVLEVGNFWFADNMQVSPAGERCLKSGPVSAIEYLQD